MNLTGVRKDDIVLIDGPAGHGSDGPALSLYRYHAVVVARENRRLIVRRLDGGEAYPVRARLVVDHWRHARAKK